MADVVASRRSLLSSLLFDGSDVVASRRSFVVSSLLMADAILVAAMPSGHVEMQSNDAR